MTPTPPSSSEGSSLPPRHRPSLGSLAKDTTEMDLWSFEEELDAAAPRTSQPAPRAVAKDIPAPRPSASAKVRDTGAKGDVIPMPNAERVSLNVSKAPVKSRSGTGGGASQPESDFDELEQWEDAGSEPEIGELPPDVSADVAEPSAPPQVAEPEPSPPAAVPAAADLTRESAADDELAPPRAAPVKAVSLLPNLRLSKIERIGLLSLLVLLLGVGASIFISSIRGLPSESAKAKSNDFPIEGRHFVVKSASNYWRAPITEGPGADTARRGTRLLPVLEVAVSGGPAAMRVLFRNEDRAVVGDVVTREIQGDERLIIAATAGFDDVGMHAAYRTGGTKPWTIEVYEAPSVDSPARDFGKLFEMNVTTDRR